jgi:hypothetical protein
MKSSGFRLILSKPAFAKTALFQSLSSSFFMREFTFPRKLNHFVSWYLFSHCAWRRKLPEAIVPDSFRNQDYLCELKYQGGRFSRTAVDNAYRYAWTSFIECTAISTSPLIMATSSVFVKIPVIPSS